MCQDCYYRDNPLDENYKSNPCNACVYWGDDGYIEYRNFKRDPDYPDYFVIDLNLK